MNTKTDFAVLLTWREDHPKGSHGPGISRPHDGKAARLYTLRVKHGAAQPMKVTLLAENKRAARRYAANRWPGAVVEAA